MADEWDYIKPDWPEDTVECRCGKVFRSHGRYSMTKGLISKKPCPSCGKHELRRLSSDPEPMIITKKDVQKL